MKLSIMGNVLSQPHPAVMQLAQRFGMEEGSLKFVRASDNFVLRFTRDGEPLILRVSNADQYTYEEIRSEMNYLNYLSEQGVRVNTPVLSSEGRLIEQEGDFFAVALTRMAGAQYEFDELPEEKFELWGSALGQLHAASKTYAGDGRATLADKVEQAKGMIAPQDAVVLQEAERVGKWLAELPRTEESYGLIHFDFEPDNLIWDGQAAQAVDFAGCVQAPFAADLAFALRDLFEEHADLSHPRCQAFLQGYRREKEIGEEQVALIPLFLEVHALLTYATLQKAADIETAQGEHAEWVVNLQNKLVAKMDAYRGHLRRTC